VIRSAAARQQLLDQGFWRDRTIVDDLCELAANTPDRIGLVAYHDDNTRIALTYRELTNQVDRLAAGLLELGVTRGEVVSFQLPNRWQFTVVALAIARIGAIANPILPILRRREVEFILQRTRSPVCIAPMSYRGFAHGEMLEEVCVESDTLRNVLLTGPQGSFEAFMTEPWEVRHSPTTLDATRPHPDDPALLMYTSGTTGEPKGVVHTYNTVFAGVQCVPRRVGLGADDVILMVSPLAHATGFFYGVVLPLVCGARTVHLDGWNADKMLEIAAIEQPTWTMGATAFVLDTCAAIEAGATPPSSLRHYVCAGAPIPRATARLAREVMQTHLLSGWGMTEVGIAAMSSPGDDIEKVASSDGFAVPGVDLKICHDDGTVAPTGEVGRLLIRTPGQHVDYFGRTDLYEEHFHDGWFDTGDLARIASDGYLRIAGRVKDLVIRGGENIPVVEVERILQEHPAVSEIAIIAVPDERLGEKACAIVVSAGEATPSLADLNDHLDTHRVAKQFWPEYLVLRDSLPKTQTGKVMKHVLRSETVQPIQAGTP
jgi:cyclohexanecarboxylate-CoA ligase